jgi:Uma2 family endonuclease
LSYNRVFISIESREEDAMASAAPTTRYTAEQYLSLERKAEFKSEYYNGFITAMSGASREHNLIAVNVAGELRSQLRNRPCEVYGSDMRILVSQTGLYTYPDAVVVCGEPRFQDDEVDTLLNPTLIVEVLSPSTESYDRGAKFAHYRRLASLQEYVLVAQDEVRVERYTRKGDEWLLTEFTRPDDSLRLASIDCEFPLSEIYAKVALTGKPATTG